MTTYSEKTGVNLLDGSSDPEGDPITVRRINGSVVSSWPHSVALTLGSASITENGGVTFDDGGSTTGHPAVGSSQANGSFTFNLWDGTDESATYTASISLEGVNDSPSGQNQTLVFEV